jgi:hypothetical protein
LGKCILSSLKHEGEILITLKSYFDGSKDQVSNQWLSLAGFASDDSSWAEFDQEWDFILRNRKIPAQYCHMRELTKLIEEFDWKKGWNDILMCWFSLKWREGAFR